METNDLTQTERERRADVEPDPANPNTCTGCTCCTCDRWNLSEPNPHGCGGTGKPCDGCACNKAQDRA